jgi:hypothetical protein
VVASAYVLVIVGEDEIPPVETVDAPVGDDIAGFPPPVLTRRGQQVAASTAVDARDLRVGLEHPLSLPDDRAMEPRARTSDLPVSSDG